MKRYPKYKDSGIEWLGEVPEHWEVKRLKYLSEVQLSSVDRHIYDNELPVSVCHYPDVYYNEKINSRLELNIGSCSADEYEKFHLKKGDVLITKDSETPDDIGISAFVEEALEKTVCGYHLSMITPVQNLLSGGFLFRFIQSKKVRHYFEVRSNGITRFGMGKDIIRNLFVGSPNLSGQQQIAAYLDHKTRLIDTLIEKKQKLVELLQEQRTALISHAVTKGLNPKAKMKDSGIEWLGEVPENWDVKPLKYIKASVPNAFVDGPFGTNLKTIHFVEEGEVLVVESGFITSGEFINHEFKSITKEHFETIKRSACFEGDIIIAKIGANFGMSGILPRLGKEAVVSGNSMKLTVDQNNNSTEFIHYHLLSLKSKGILGLQVKTTAQPALSLGGMNDLKFAIPPKSEQDEIAKYLNATLACLNEIRNTTIKQIELYQEYRTTLISDVVTGKIDIRDEVMQ